MIQEVQDMLVQRNVPAKEAAQLLGISKSKVYELMDAEVIKSVRPIPGGRLRRIPLDALREYMAKMRDNQEA